MEVRSDMPLPNLGREEEGIFAQIERIADLSEEGFKRQSVLWFGKKVLPQRADLDAGSTALPVFDLVTAIHSLQVLLPKLKAGQPTQDLKILQGHLITIKGQLDSTEFARNTSFDSVLQEVEELYREVTDQVSARHPTKKAKVMTEFPSELLSSNVIDATIVSLLWKNDDIAITTEGEKRELVFSDRLAKFLDDSLLAKILQLSKKQKAIARVNAFTFIQYPLLGPQSISIMMQKSPLIDPIYFGNAFNFRPDQFCDYFLQVGQAPIHINKAFVSHHIPGLITPQEEFGDWVDFQAVAMCLRVVAGRQDLIETEGNLKLLVLFLDHACSFGLSEAVEKAAITRILQRVLHEKNVRPVVEMLQRAHTDAAKSACVAVLKDALEDIALLKEIENQHDVLDILCDLEFGERVDLIIFRQRDELLKDYQRLGHHIETAHWMSLIELEKTRHPYVHLTRRIGLIFWDFDYEELKYHEEIMNRTDKNLHEKALTLLLTLVKPNNGLDNLFVNMRLCYLACFPGEGKTPDLQKARDFFECAIRSGERGGNNLILYCFEIFSKYILQAFNNEAIVDEEKARLSSFIRQKKKPDCVEKQL